MKKSLPAMHPHHNTNDFRARAARMANKQHAKPRRVLHALGQVNKKISKAKMSAEAALAKKYWKEREAKPINKAVLARFKPTPKEPVNVRGLVQKYWEKRDAKEAKEIAAKHQKKEKLAKVESKVEMYWASRENAEAEKIRKLGPLAVPRDAHPKIHSAPKVIDSLVSTYWKKRDAKEAKKVAAEHQKKEKRAKMVSDVEMYWASRDNKKATPWSHTKTTPKKPSEIHSLVSTYWQKRDAKEVEAEGKKKQEKAKIQ